MLRQNPNNVFTWLNRIDMCSFDNFFMIKTFTDAVTTIDPYKSHGRLSDLW